MPSYRWVASPGGGQLDRQHGPRAGRPSAARSSRPYHQHRGPGGDPPQPGDHPADADLLHPRRHPRRRHLRPHRPGRRRRRRGHLGLVPGLVPARPDHRLRLPGAGDQVPEGRRGRPLRPPGVPHRHPQLHGHHRRDGLGGHLGLVRGHPGRRPLLDGRVRDREPADRAHRHPGHPAGGGRELPGRRRVDQGQHRHHPDRAVGPAVHHPGRVEGAVQRRRRPRAGVRVQGQRVRGPAPASPPGRPPPSTPSSASRTR